MSSYIENARIVLPGQRIAPSGSVTIADGRIVGVNAPPPPGADCTDAAGRLLTPGLIDLHTHGVGHCLYEASPEQLLEGIATLPRFGTTGVLPTLYRVMDRNSLPLLERLSDALDQVRGACAPGWHLEGPFLKLPGAGAATIPGDVGLLKEVLAATGGRTRAMSISPDTPNIIPVIEHLAEQRIVVFVTHTQASVEQTERAIDAGARHATHFYDVFPQPEITEPGRRPCGAVEVMLSDPRCTVDFICDGVHVEPAAVRLALAVKGYAGVVLITDSNIGAGLPDGVYDTPWGFPIKVSATNAARNNDTSSANFGTLAGSALTMNAGIANLHRWLKIPSEQIWAMGSLNPAGVMGMGSKGRVEVGADADLVLWNDDYTAHKTWVAGEIVYSE